MSIAIRVLQGDALDVETDVLALKYAQALYGADYAAAYRLAEKGQDILTSLPAPDEYLLVDSNGAIGARHALFVGTSKPDHLDYEQLRQLAAKTLETLGDQTIPVQHVAVTVHGVGFGLDEAEAFRSQIAGFLDAIQRNKQPRDLQSITVVEHNGRRAEHFADILREDVPDGVLKPMAEEVVTRSSPPLTSAGLPSISKLRVFVAMPFREDMEDVFHYGIRNAVNAMGYLCERADLTVFTGDVLQWVKDRISTSELVIADLSGANPNVYLEIGFAWGCNRPTLLVLREPEEPTFNARGHRYLTYRSIKDLEAKLVAELQGLQASTADDHRIGP
jgi:hypothetical protein